jgi:hypothetical protein
MLLAAIVGIVACGRADISSTDAATATTPTPSSNAAASPAQTTPAASSSPTGQPVTRASTGALTIDPTLLAILPESVAGFAIQPSPAADLLLDDADLANSATTVAVGIVTGGEVQEDDFAVATVVRLRPGIYSEDFYAAWRVEYDEAACEPAGGVSGHDQRVIGGRTVEIATCTGGAQTFHTHLAGDVLVSITGVGDRRFGDLVMAGLRG